LTTNGHRLTAMQTPSSQHQSMTSFTPPRLTPRLYLLIWPHKLRRPKACKLRRQRQRRALPAAEPRKSACRFRAAPVARTRSIAPRPAKSRLGNCTSTTAYLPERSTDCSLLLPLHTLPIYLRQPAPLPRSRLSSRRRVQKCHLREQFDAKVEFPERSQLSRRRSNTRLVSAHRGSRSLQTKERLCGTRFQEACQGW
jgi:hypothetical protein